MKPNTQYLVEETRWMLSFNTNPLDIVKALHMQPASIYRMATRHQFTDIRDAFTPYAHGVKA
jgi:hypothetical protein